MSEPTGGVLYVRLRRTGPNEPRTKDYTIGGTTFLYDHEGWYEVPEAFGRELRRKKLNPLNPAVSPPLFEVLTREEVINLERAQRAEAEAAVQRKEQQFSGQRIQQAIPKNVMQARRVGSLLAESEAAVSQPERARSVNPDRFRRETPVQLAQPVQQVQQIEREERFTPEPAGNGGWDDEEEATTAPVSSFSPTSNEEGEEEGVTLAPAATVTDRAATKEATPRVAPRAQAARTTRTAASGRRGIRPADGEKS